MDNGGNGEEPGAIQITEPIVFEIEAPVIPGLPVITTPPGVGLGGVAINIQYICPLSIHCGTDIPCNFTKAIALPLSLPLPVFSFPPSFAFPVFGFRFEIPPPIFVKCPAFEEEDASAQTVKDAEAAPPTEDPTEIPAPEDASVDLREGVVTDKKMADTLKSG